MDSSLALGAGDLMLATALLRDAKKKPRIGWTRASGNPILSAGAAWETNNAVQEPTVLYDAAAGLPMSAKFGMWYTGGYTNPAMGYAYCTAADPTNPANWTKYASNPILGQGAVVAGFVSGNNVVKVGSTYYAYYYDTLGGGNLKVSTSTDGLTWSAPTTALASNAVSWMTGWANCFVWNEGGTTWKMLVEGRSTTSGTPWRIAYATSTDGLTWTVVGTGPLTSLVVGGAFACGGPWLLNGGQKIGGLYHLYFHAGGGGANYSDIYHAYSSDAQNWTVAGLELEPNYGTYEAQQAADPSAIEVGGISYLFYDGVNNSTIAGYINVATIPGKVSDLVLWEN